MLAHRCLSIGLISMFALPLASVPEVRSADHAAVRGLDGQVAKQVLTLPETDENLLRPDAWRPWQSGFVRDGEMLVCDNGDERQAQRGASQTVILIDQVQVQRVIRTRRTGHVFGLAPRRSPPAATTGSGGR